MRTKQPEAILQSSREKSDDNEMLHLKPPVLRKAWLLSDGKKKVRIADFRERQAWNKLAQRIAAEWDDEADGDS